jgi:hypothetical protein
MPATFDSFGLKFLYPDNWSIVDRGDDEGTDGVTFELPTGGFFTIEPIREGQLEQELVEEVAESIEDEYGEVEREEVPSDDESRIVDFQFYYLDLLIISRLKIFTIGTISYYIQMQAESRDFEENALVFEAILKQIREM